MSFGFSNLNNLLTYVEKDPVVVVHGTADQGQHHPSQTRVQQHHAAVHALTLVFAVQYLHYLLYKMLNLALGPTTYIPAQSTCCCARSHARAVNIYIQPSVQEHHAVVAIEDLLNL